MDCTQTITVTVWWRGDHQAAGGGQRPPEEPEQEPAFPAPLTANAYENARRLTIRELSPKLEGFRADPEEKLGHLDHWKNGWVGQKPGDKITFEVDASCIAVQYRKTIRRPALRAQLVLDGDAAYLFCWTVTLTRTGATACICSLSCTTGNIEHTPWS